jgi:hypothetical protein
MLPMIVEPRPAPSFGTILATLLRLTYTEGNKFGRRFA